jgi:hypothetical protein
MVKRYARDEGFVSAWPEHTLEYWISCAIEAVGDLLRQYGKPDCWRAKKPGGVTLPGYQIYSWVPSRQ